MLCIRVKIAPLELFKYLFSDDQGSSGPSTLVKKVTTDVQNGLKDEAHGMLVEGIMFEERPLKDQNGSDVKFDSKSENELPAKPRLHEGRLHAWARPESAHPQSSPAVYPHGVGKFQF